MEARKEAFSVEGAVLHCGPVVLWCIHSARRAKRTRPRVPDAMNKSRCVEWYFSTRTRHTEYIAGLPPSGNIQYLTMDERHEAVKEPFHALYYYSTLYEHAGGDKTTHRADFWAAPGRLSDHVTMG